MAEDALIIELRKLIEDEAAVDFTETQLRTYLNRHRIKLTDITLLSEDNDYLIYHAEAQNLMDVVLTDENDNVITPSVSDTLNGIFTFAAAQTIVTLNCTSHELYQTAFEIWIIRAQRTHFSGEVKLGDEVIPQDKNNSQYCLKKAYAIKPSRMNLKVTKGSL